MPSWLKLGKHKPGHPLLKTRWGKFFRCFMIYFWLLKADTNFSFMKKILQKDVWSLSGARLWEPGGRASKELIKICSGVKLRQGETQRLLMRKLTVFWPLWVNESTRIIGMIATLKSYDVKTWTLKANIAIFSPHIKVIYLCQMHLVWLVALLLEWSVALLNKLSGARRSG